MLRPKLNHLLPWKTFTDLNTVYALFEEKKKEREKSQENKFM